MDFFKNRKDLDNDIESKWKCILTEDEIKVCVKKCANEINKKFVNKDIVLTCILKGAAYFLVDLSRELIIPHSLYFIEASSYKDEQNQHDLEILSRIIPEKFNNKYVILIDELFDNGNTIENVKNTIHEKASVPLDKFYTCTLFIKNKKVSLSPPNLYGIRVPDVWLIGYGLDDKQHKRNWTYLFACPKSNGIEETVDDQIFKNNDYYSTIRSKLLRKVDKYLNEYYFDVVLDFIKKNTLHFDESHNYKHALLVYNNAKKIMDSFNRPYDADILIFAALLHDVCDHKYYNSISSNELHSFIYHHIPNKADIIIKIIDNVSYSKEVSDKKEVLEYPYDQLLDAISDADKIEALGKTGIKRCKIFTKMKGGRIPEDVIVHCREKLLRLYPENFIKTKLGREIALPLHNYVVDYVAKHSQSQNNSIDLSIQF